MSEEAPPTAEEWACATEGGWAGSCREVGRPSMYLWCRPCLSAQVESLERIVQRVADMPCVCHPLDKAAGRICLGDQARAVVEGSNG